MASKSALRGFDEDCKVVLGAVLDACSLLNLVSSRRFADIAQERVRPFVTSEQAAAEVRYVRRGGEVVDANERDAISLKEFEERGLLTILRLETAEERNSFVTFAQEMDDGEAAACALAVCHGGTFVTDDRKARRVMSHRSPLTPLLTTSEVIKEWADRMGLDIHDLAILLRNVEERASFRPGRHDPLGTWWESVRTRF